MTAFPCRTWRPALALLLVAPSLRAAEVKVRLPPQRTAYQTNEWIDISVVRADSKTPAASELRALELPANK